MIIISYNINFGAGRDLKLSLFTNLIYSYVALSESHSSLKISQESIKCVDGRARLCGFGTQNLNEFPEFINEILRIFIESKTSF